MRLIAAFLALSLLSGCGKESDPAQGTKAPVTPTAMTAPAQQAPAADKGRLKYVSVCQGCHGRDGQGQGPFPKLAGKPVQELARMLQQYRAGKIRGPQSATMMPFAKPLSDEEIEAIARHLASL